MELCLTNFRTEIASQHLTDDFSYRQCRIETQFRKGGMGLPTLQTDDPADRSRCKSIVFKNQTGLRETGQVVQAVDGAWTVTLQNAGRPYAGSALPCLFRRLEKQQHSTFYRMSRNTLRHREQNGSMTVMAAFMRHTFLFGTVGNHCLLLNWKRINVGP